MRLDVATIYSKSLNNLRLFKKLKIKKRFNQGFFQISGGNSKKSTDKEILTWNSIFIMTLRKLLKFN